MDLQRVEIKASAGTVFSSESLTEKNLLPNSFRSLAGLISLWLYD